MISTIITLVLSAVAVYFAFTVLPNVFKRSGKILTDEIVPVIEDNAKALRKVSALGLINADEAMLNKISTVLVKPRSALTDEDVAKYLETIRNR